MSAHHSVEVTNDPISNLILDKHARTLSFQVDAKAKTIIAGFSDGVIRVMTVAQAGEDQAPKKLKQDIDLDLKQVFKPHNKAVTSIAVNDKGEILATGVSFP